MAELASQQVLLWGAGCIIISRVYHICRLLPESNTDIDTIKMCLR